MPVRLEAGKLLEDLESFDPETDSTEVVSFAQIGSKHPFYDGSEEGLRVVNVSGFAELAYCPYKTWHTVLGTPVIRPPRIAKAVDKGTRVHVDRQTRLLDQVAKAKPATKKQLRDPYVDLVELPEFSGRFRREGWLYRAKLDGLARESGDLVIHEMKTGRYAEMPDHLLQVWAYCIAAPGAMLRATDGNLAATGLSWTVEYPGLGRTWGPFPFTEAQLNLLERAFLLFEGAGVAAVSGSALDLSWSPRQSKCSPCGYSHSCQWRSG